jgi:hypothetical protein
MVRGRQPIVQTAQTHLVREYAASGVSRFLAALAVAGAVIARSTFLLHLPLASGLRRIETLRASVTRASRRCE